MKRRALVEDSHVQFTILLQGIMKGIWLAEKGLAREKLYYVGEKLYILCWGETILCWEETILCWGETILCWYQNCSTHGH